MNDRKITEIIAEGKFSVGEVPNQDNNEEDTKKQKSEIVSCSELKQKLPVVKTICELLRERRIEKLKNSKVTVRKIGKIGIKDNELIRSRNRSEKCTVNPKTNELKVDLINRVEMQKLVRDSEKARKFDITKINFKPIEAKDYYMELAKKSQAISASNPNAVTNNQRTPPIDNTDPSISVNKKYNEYLNRRSSSIESIDEQNFGRQNTNNSTIRKMDAEGFIEPPARKTAKIDRNARQTHITETKNKYGTLEIQEHSEMDTDTDPVPRKNNNNNKRTWIPPITITDRLGNYNQFNEEVKKILGHSDFYTRFNSNMTAKLYLKTNNDHNKMIEDFKRNDIGFYTQTKNEDKTKKIVLKAAPGMDIEDIKDDLEELGHKVIEVISLKSRQNQSRSYLISFPMETNIGQIKMIQNIGNLRIQWERYNKKNNWTQCRRCQKFGHSQTNCNNTPKCVKCPNNHYYEDCPMKKGTETIAYCHNCGGDHAANYHKCPALLEYLQRRNINPNTNNPTRQEVNLSKNIQWKNVKEFPRLNRNENINETSYDNEQEPNTEYRDRLIKNRKTEQYEESTDLKDILKIIGIIKKLKSELRRCRDPMDKALIVLEYIDQF